MRKQFYRLLITIGALSLTSSNALQAATFLVNNLSDSGSGSLRNALFSAEDGDTISFESGLSGSIFLESSLPIINSSLTIVGNGSVTIDGQGDQQVFFVNQGNVSISHLNIADGASTGGNGGSSPSGKGGGSLGAGGGLFADDCGG